MTVIIIITKSHDFVRPLSGVMQINTYLISKRPVCSRSHTIIILLGVFFIDIKSYAMRQFCALYDCATPLAKSYACYKCTLHHCTRKSISTTTQHDTALQSRLHARWASLTVLICRYALQRCIVLGGCVYSKNFWKIFSWIRVTAIKERLDSGQYTTKWHRQRHMTGLRSGLCNRGCIEDEYVYKYEFS